MTESQVIFESLRFRNLAAEAPLAVPTSGRAAKASLAMPPGGHAGFAGVAVCLPARPSAIPGRGHSRIGVQ